MDKPVLDPIDEKESKEIGLGGIPKCKHEIDLTTMKYSRRCGREGYCIKCKRKVHLTTFISQPKRERAKMKKKQRRKINKAAKELKG